MRMVPRPRAERTRCFERRVMEEVLVGGSKRERGRRHASNFLITIPVCPRAPSA